MANMVSASLLTIGFQTFAQKFSIVPIARHVWYWMLGFKCSHKPAEDIIFLSFSLPVFRSFSAHLTWLTRLGTSLGRGGKATVVIDKSHNIWILNSTEDTLAVQPGELFGFGTGQYSVTGDCHLVAI